MSLDRHAPSDDWRALAHLPIRAGSCRHYPTDPPLLWAAPPAIIVGMPGATVDAAREGRRIIWMMSVSVDGYMEGPNREIDWHLVDHELHSHLNGWLAEAGGFLEGRVTYQLMTDFWPTADQDPTAEPTVIEFARIWRDMPKVVYSRTLDRADWNATLVRDVVPDEVSALKAQPGGDLVLGGGELGAEFARQDLIDEYRLYVHPVVIGRGKPMLRPSEAKVPLRLVETQTFGSGVVMLRYERRPPTSASGEA